MSLFVVMDILRPTPGLTSVHLKGNIYWLGLRLFAASSVIHTSRRVAMVELSVR